jgi:hypothetical protein
MMEKLITDSKSRPELFHWVGPTPRAIVDRWAALTGASLPPDLVFLWTSLGGGDLFETETILSLAEAPPDGLVDAVSSRYHQAGLSRKKWVVHTGYVTTVVEGETGLVEVIGKGFEVLENYSSLEEWYEQVIRSEYADRYGLPK